MRARVEPPPPAHEVVLPSSRGQTVATCIVCLLLGGLTPLLLLAAAFGLLAILGSLDLLSSLTAVPAMPTLSLVLSILICKWVYRRSGPGWFLVYIAAAVVVFAAICFPELWHARTEHRQGDPSGSLALGSSMVVAYLVVFGAGGSWALAAVWTLVRGLRSWRV